MGRRGGDKRTLLLSGDGQGQFLAGDRDGTESSERVSAQGDQTGRSDPSQTRLTQAPSQPTPSDPRLMQSSSFQPLDRERERAALVGIRTLRGRPALERH